MIMNTLHLILFWVGFASLMWLCVRVFIGIASGILVGKIGSDKKSPTWLVFWNLLDNHRRRSSLHMVCSRYINTIN
jgi:hypothetical protein